MKNRILGKIIILFIAFVFVSTAVYAKSGNSSSMKYSHSWWFMPFYQMKRAANELNTLQNEISKLQRKSNRLESEESMLEKKLIEMKAKIDLRRNHKNVLNNDESAVKNEDNKNEVTIKLCPACNFTGIDDLDNYDLSWAYLRSSSFRNAILNHTNFSQANLKKSYFINAQLNGVIFSGADLSGANFTDATFTNVIWGDDQNGYAICPDGDSAAEHEGGSCTEPLL